MIISPSLLSADFSNLKNDIDLINQSNAQWIHLDVMDGRFVPNISFGFPVLEAVKKYSKKVIDVHLMIVEPEKYTKRFAEKGADIICVHYEACPNLNRTLQEIRSFGAKAGVVINPHTPVACLEDTVPFCDVAMLMSVNPGYGGQAFIENTYYKCKQLAEMIQRKNPNCILEIDGGVDLHNIGKLKDYGAKALVAGSSVFKSPEPLETINKMVNY